MDIQDLLGLANVAFLYVVDVVYAVYAVRDIARDCRGNHRCVINDVVDFLAITALTSLVLSPLYVVPILLDRVWHVHGLLTPTLGIIAVTVLIGEAVAYMSRFTILRRGSRE